MPARTIFITGTDTGVGKTLLTGLLLAHLRQNHVHALAMKPFCSGGRADAELLGRLQNDELTQNEINPFYFSQPLAPLVAARSRKRWVTLENALIRIQNVAMRCEVLLVEGIGGACVPLGKNYLVANLIRELRCETVVVTSNRLGTLHSTLSTFYSLKSFGVTLERIALMEQRRPDLSARSNGIILEEWLNPRSLVSVPYLGANACHPEAVNKSAKKIKKTLAKLLR